MQPRDEPDPSRPIRDPLLPVLERVEEELEQVLEEVCETKVKEESTGGFMKLEEKLLEAADAAKQAFSIRRRMRLQREGANGAADPHDAETDDVHAEEHEVSTAVRTLRTSDGTVWQIWAVKPGRVRPAAGTDHLGEYRAGWLAFEATNGTQRRRLPNHPEDWQHLSDDALAALLQRAEPVRPLSRD